MTVVSVEAISVAAVVAEGAGFGVGFERVVAAPMFALETFSTGVPARTCVM